jgi:CHASE2 domain-containing sensor protein
MARGDHPQRTPFYGVCLSGAFLACWLASSIRILWLSIASYVLAALAAVVGFVMTFRNYSFQPPSRH